jgi:uncharacterized repeat protein (TIGR02543 family)
MPANDITVYAKWSINQYTISFQSNGGTSINPITQDYGTSVSAPTPPTKTGYTFMGWYRDEAFNTGYSFTTMPAESPTLYAKWSINQYTITFSTNGGDPISNQTKDYASSLILPTPTKVGHSFVGWFKDIDLSQAAPATMPADDITVYAKWSINAYTISFQSNGGTSINPITQDYGTSVVAPSSPTKTGYTFAGWFTDINLSQSAPMTMPASNFTLYAKWNFFPQFIFNSGNHSSILNSTGRVFVWGNNAWGQLGDGTNTDRNVPTEITSRFQLISGDKIISLSLALSTSSAVSSTGRVFMWGSNYYGSVGNGTYSYYSTVPTEITSRFPLTSDDKIVSLSLGTNYSSALSSNGRVFMWGKNDEGQLGDGTNTNRNVPSEITSLFPLISGDKITSLSLAESTSSALSSSGRVFTWGYNRDGRLGDGTNTNRNVPTEITSAFSLVGSDKINSLSLGSNSSSALSSSGRVFTWGNNGQYELGDGTNTSRNVPTEITSSFEIASDERIISLELGGNSGLVFTSSGRIYIWGNYNGTSEVITYPNPTIFQYELI